MSRPRVLLAPVTVSPTKPLTPSHLKVLLPMDMLHRATATFAEVTHVYTPLAHAGSRQVAGFWEYLDRVHPGLDAPACSEERIGELYTEFQRGEPVSNAALAPVVARAAEGWAHPVSVRLLDLWARHYRTLGMRDPSFGRTGPAPMAVDDLVDELAVRHLAIDGRSFGAPVYLDATSAGLPLRMVVGADGHANYLVTTLCELVPLLAGHDHVVLAHDPELRADYRTVAHVLGAFGVGVSRLEFARVPLNGSVRSARHGDWRGYTVGALAHGFADEYGEAAFALGYRLYLLAGLGRTAGASFTHDRFRRWVRRAAGLLDQARPGERVSLAPLAGRSSYVDPFRLAATVLGRDTDPDLLATLLDVLAGPTGRVSLDTAA
ncbi:hypothetical protein BLA60_37060 [Actinophytocola xinjiangensis]|uniref:Uncharacterized protein n=1 Tax=Actinophytocola xinjiangensis TaxID=485602 RepID=A0A7Z1ATW6_9PSEU|nr:hypothetical protein [Actinophytocola xinjiangensis]OLF05267.1 hypothetical protein BLA60_37060 [Actinophytocola xinjiangensis]